MSIAGSDGRLADGSEHSLGLYHSAPRPESASSASPPSQVTLLKKIILRLLHLLHHSPHQLLPHHPLFTQVHPGHYLPFPTSSAASAHSTGGLIVPQPINATKVMMDM